MCESQRWLILVGVAGALWLLYLLAPVLTPFLLAALFAYLGDPLVDRLERLRLPRGLAVALVFVVIVLVLLALLLLLIPLLQVQLAGLVRRVPQYLDTLQHGVLPWLQRRFGVTGVLDVERLRETFGKNLPAAGGIAARVLASASSSGVALLGWVMNLLLTPVITFYLLRDWDRIWAQAADLLPRRAAPTVLRLTHEADQVLSGFVRGQLLVMVALGTIYSVGLALIGVDLALLIGMLSGLVSFVPYLGFIVGVIAAGVAAVLQSGDPTQLLYVLAVYGVAQITEGVVLTPLLVGDRIGLHPVVVIFAVLAGGQLFGFMGILLALPAAAVLAVLARHLHGRYTQSHLYEEEPVP